MQNKKIRDIRKIFLDKVGILSIVFFVLALFLLDVNLNLVAAYGLGVESPILNGGVVSSASLFWLGFLMMSVCFFIVSVRSFSRRKSYRWMDIFFAILGIVGWGIILSGGLLVFFGGDDFIIPFFSFLIPRIDYYHVGIGAEVLTIIYFALTK